MSPRLISALAQVLSWLPLRANQALGAMLGRLIWVSNTSPRRITEVNLKLCYPDMASGERKRLAHSSLIETGKQLTESAWIWNRPSHQTRQKIVEITGEHWLDKAYESNQGLIMISPHVGNWELCLLPLSQKAPFTYFYRSPRQAGMDNLLIKWRSNLGGKAATLDAKGIRHGLKVLKKGEMLGILPDQEPDSDNGLFAPFFNEPALTMTLLPKLANRSSATLLFCVAERLPRAQGWRFHILPAEAAIASTDLKQAAAALNRGVEQCIALCPAQYLWDYKRFATLEDGSRRSYR